MKTSDYVSIAFVAIFVTILAYFVVNSLMGDPNDAIVRFKYLSNVNTDIVTPDSEVFNAAAINPTVEVYVGSCVDLNQNGILDDDEKVACGEDALKTDTGVTESQYVQANQGLSNDENNAINNAEGYANGTTAEQRDAVESDIQNYQNQQQQQNQENAANNAASRETVSGS